MRLLTRTGLYYMAATTLVLIAGAFVFFYFVSREFGHELDELLEDDMEMVQEQIAELDSLTPEMFLFTGHVSVTRVEPGFHIPFDDKDDYIISDSNTYDSDHEVTPYRKIMFYAQSRHPYTYQVVISRSLLESEDLMEAIYAGLIVLFVIFLVALFLLNRYISRNTWKTFYQNLDILQHYSFDTGEKIALAPSRIREFKALNKAISAMTDKIHRDYNSLKEFTENASHEIQTPLAIIKNKLELLIQEDLNEEQARHIHAAYDAAGRLSKLNSTLLLLTKIEHHQFIEKEQVNLSALIQKQLLHYQELIEARELTLVADIAPDIALFMNPMLAEILVTNLLSNAIKHNAAQGEINILLEKGSLRISNPGAAPKQDPEQLFERFKKGSSHTESLGLGLFLVKTICESQHIAVAYRYQAPRHIISLSF